MTLLYPVRQRLSTARLYAVVVPAPFTPPDALVRRVEDLVAAGVGVIQLDLDGWAREDAVSVLNRCTPVVVPSGRLLVVGHALDVAADLGADALLLGPAQNLPADLPEHLGEPAALGREVGDEAHLGKTLEAPGVSFLVLVGDRSTQVAARAHQLAPLVGPDAYVDPASGSRPWFVDLGPRWTQPEALPERACRVRFEVFVPADSPVDASTPQLRADVADLAARVDARWEADSGLVAQQEQLLADNAQASTSFRGTATEPEVLLPDGDPETAERDPHAADPYDSDAVRNYRGATEPGQAGRGNAILDFFRRVLRRAPAGSRPDAGGPGSEGSSDGRVRE